MSSPTETALASRRAAKDSVRDAAPAVLFFPEASRKEWLVTLGLFLVSCAYLRLFRDGMTFDPDEGVALQGAARILHGQVLYRDFFSFMTPGSYYWMALLFKIFGTSKIVARTMVIAYGALYSSLTYLLARRISGRGASLGAAYLLLVSAPPRLAPRCLGPSQRADRIFPSTRRSWRRQTAVYPKAWERQKAHSGLHPKGSMWQRSLNRVMLEGPGPSL